MKQFLYTLSAIAILVGLQSCLPTLTVTNYSICQNNTVPSGQGMVASTTLTSSINWYAAPTGGSVLYTGTVFNPVGVAGSGITNTGTSGTTTFYAIEQTSTSSRTAVTFTINPSPTASITSNTTVVCSSGANATLSANTGTGLTYQWKLNGSNVSGATNATYTTNVTGAYTCAVSNSTCGPIISNSITLTAGTPPTATATAAGATSFCPGGSVVLNANTGTGLTYQWQQNGSNISGATNAAYTASGTGSYTVIVTNVAGCNATSSAIAVSANGSFTVAIAYTGPVNVCAGNPVTLNSSVSSSAVTYQWNLNGIAVPGATDASFQCATSGNYTVTAHDASISCTVTSNPMVITVYPQPNSYVAYASPLSFCEGGAVVLTANTDPALTCQWLRDGYVIPGATGYYNVAEQTGYYSVIATDVHNCADTSDRVSINVFPLPQPTITRTANVFATASTFSNYQWLRNGAEIPGATQYSYTATSNGAFSVTVWDANNCTRTSDAIFINDLSANGAVAPSDQIIVYPNPTAKIVFIDAPQSSLNVYLCTMDGKLVCYWLATKEVDLTDVAAGNYVMTLLDQDNRVLKVEKLLKSDK
ncbi:T9SS type A sorting domain-containing protein [Taibaiella soli]|uniref:Ig-like domain-containing protein n=1 Tax=Taibaiella soli TaxID=1649169 RepID=A0A2W2B7I3_9BACT|nr:T9SS type A sorting domain-containing protein [Taibaiella soli]PZF71977.1 hypothetical protein DN068_15180 [Taibaiella soli]